MEAKRVLAVRSASAHVEVESTGASLLIIPSSSVIAIVAAASDGGGRRGRRTRRGRQHVRQFHDRPTDCDGVARCRAEAR